MDLEKSAFVDESGDPSLETQIEGVTRFYSVCAVIANRGTLDAVTKHADAVRGRFFQIGQMKSSYVGPNLPKRIAILRAISEMDIKCYCFVVDKEVIDKASGLAYKRTFIKYVYGRLLRLLFRVLSSVEVIADRQGRPEFMLGFQKYVGQNHMPTLFSTSVFYFGESAKIPLIQVADFVAGSIRVAMDSPAEEKNAIIRAIEPVLLALEDWPVTSLLSGIADTSTITKHDEIIREQSLRQASIFITEHAPPGDQDVVLQLETLQYLLYKFNVFDSAAYVSTDELLSILNDLEEAPISVPRFRSKVIGTLRDAGVIIASSPKGYKIPASLSDIHDFVSHASLIIAPMLKRLTLARNAILVATDGKCDIVDNPEHSVLKRIVEAAKA